MAGQRIIDIGVEGNDGTGDSIRESFSKTNENFDELYAVFGQGGTIDFTSLGDTADSLIPNGVPVVNDTATLINILELASNSALDEDESDTITFDFSAEGKLVLTTAFGQLADDASPTLGGPLNVQNNAVANVAISQFAVDEFNTRHNDSINIDDLVITKGFGDRRYITSGLPIRVADEPASTDQYNLDINRYVDGNVEVLDHGFDRTVNGQAFTFDSRYNDPTGLESEVIAENILQGRSYRITETDGVDWTTFGAERNEISQIFEANRNGESQDGSAAIEPVYFLRFVNSDQLSVFLAENEAEDPSDTSAEKTKVFVDGSIPDDEVHVLTDAGFDPNLEGNYLANTAVPRKGVVRRQGDTMTGALTLHDHPGELSGFGNLNGDDDLQAASKLYVDTTTFSSPENLFVSRSGDDSMQGVPPGREGTALDYAYRTVNAAAKRAEELIATSPSEPGPYFQNITIDQGADFSTVIDASIKNPSFTLTAQFIQDNLDYVVRETIGYIEFTYPDFVFNREILTGYLKSILSAINFDIQRGTNANTLTRQAAQQFYADADGIAAITTQKTQTVDALDFANLLLDALFQNELFKQKDIAAIVVDQSTTVPRARVTTTSAHGYLDGEQIIFQNIGGMTEIEGQTAYIRVISDTVVELYEDDSLLNFFNISSYTGFTTGGEVGVVYQERENYIDSVKLKPDFKNNTASPGGVSAVASKFSLVDTIIDDGIDAGPDVAFGENYKIVIENGSESYVDQGNPNNLDTLPGKVIVGDQSGARGRIVRYINEDPNENDKDTYELLPLNPVDFIEGETLTFGNFVKNKQVTIFVESGIYEEDFPIKLANNVSLKGDEFRRVIIRPKLRTSQSKYAATYFYRDLEFDDIPLLDKKHSTVTALDGTEVAVDDTSWMSVDQPVKFAGSELIGSEAERNTTYYITAIIEDPAGDTVILSDEEGGTDISWVTAEGEMYIVAEEVGYFLNQTDDIQGYFGKFYLENPYADKDVGILPTNDGGFSTAARILERNRRFIQEEIIQFVNAGISSGSPAEFAGFSYDGEQFTKQIGNVVDALVRDLEFGGSEFSLEQQGEFYVNTEEADRDAVQSAIEQISVLASDLLDGDSPSQQGDIVPDTSLGPAEAGTIGIVTELVALVYFAFNDDYNPPKRNDADGVDVFQMSDATIVRNVTVQGHGGFMVVLDPNEQILTKSPYIQTGSSFSKSDNAKRFRGGMFVDAFVGNIPARVISKAIDPATGQENNFELNIESELGQGLFIRPPQLPAPFFYEGIRYQVNAISGYDSGNGVATLLLDRSSNPDPATGIGQGFTASAPQEIFIQTAGNRSMLGNDFTQINDLGYGLVTNNGAVSEMVSMFTYYCQAAYYAKNGSEIRSLNGSNGYGFFGLVAEGSDPNEIPDQVTLGMPLVQPAKVYTSATETNEEGDQTIYLTDFKFPPTASSIIRVDHGGSVGILNYRISNIRSLSDNDQDGQIGDSGEDITASGTEIDNAIYALNITADANIQGDFFESLQADIADGTLVEYRNGPNLLFDGIRNQDALQTRPSTAINFDESDATTYRTLAFSPKNSAGVELNSEQIIATAEVDYDYITLTTDVANLSGGFGDTAGDTAIAVNEITDERLTARLTRDIAGRQPDNPDYSGGMIFSYAGKTHKIIEYNDTSEDFAYVVFEDVDNTNINGSKIGNTGLNSALPVEELKIFAGLPENTTAEITIAISLLRATGHDFTQIGAGGYNSSNYPNVIFGQPSNSLAQDYSAAPTVTSSQVWERRKGRVFYVSTDQDGFFRVGKFFSVDQGTGDVTFSGSIGISGANALGFTRGVTISEFSADDSFSDQDGGSVPTERATYNYINRVLGYNRDGGGSQIQGAPAGVRLGPGFLPLNGDSSMEGNLNLGDNKIQNVFSPENNSDAANKAYVDTVAQTFDDVFSLRDTEINSQSKNDLLVATGAKKIFLEDGLGLTVGDTVGTLNDTKTGTVIDVQDRNDSILGNIDEITYEPVLGGDFEDGETVYRNSDFSEGFELIDAPIDEWANASEKSSSVINVTVERNQNSTTYDLQIENGSIKNTDVNADAEIAQSKLNMQNADLFDEDSVWSGTTKTQADLGLAKFSDLNFDVTEGYVRIKDNGIVFAELPDLDRFQVYGRNQSGTGDATAIDFDTLVDQGKGLEDRDFANTVVDSDTGSPGNALVQLQEDDGNGDSVYGVTEISVSSNNNSIVKRSATGKIDASALQISGDDIIERLSNTIFFNTPGGAQVFSTGGEIDATLVTKFPGRVDVGDTGISSESTFHGRSALAGEGYLASDWIYTSFIEAASERDSQSTGIGIGDNVGFDEGGENAIILVTGGSTRFRVDNTGTEIFGDLIVSGGLSLDSDVTIGEDSDDDLIINADIASNIIPKNTTTYNIGSNGARFDTMYANVFNGVATEAKYADLAELYVADFDYAAGTVVIFGGDKEVTVTSEKGDRRVAGVVSTNPAYLMNNELDEENTVPVALQGRLPCLVLGRARKGDLLVSSAISGYAVVNNDAKIGTVIGKALENKDSDGKGLIEIVVGRV